MEIEDFKTPFQKVRVLYAHTESALNIPSAIRKGDIDSGGSVSNFIRAKFTDFLQKRRAEGDTLLGLIPSIP